MHQIDTTATDDEIQRALLLGSFCDDGGLRCKGSGQFVVTQLIFVKIHFCLLT